MFLFPIKISELSQDEIGIILDNIKTKKSYYAGGSLCVDDALIKEDDVLVMNLDGSFYGFGEGVKNTLSTENRKKVFSIYLDIKGDTEYYREQYEKSGIKDLEN